MPPRPSSPLTEVSLAPGPHRVQIRSAGFSQHNALVDVKPGERQTLTYTFSRSASESAPRKSDWWRDLKRKFGGS